MNDENHILNRVVTIYFNSSDFIPGWGTYLHIILRITSSIAFHKA
jgi:hypothetical protein